MVRLGNDDRRRLVRAPGFLEQFGPLLAALIALAGGVVGLIITGRREARRFRLQREDDFRREHRAVIAAVVVPAQVYRRECGELGAVERWMSLAYEQAAARRDAAERARGELLSQLTAARLVVRDGQLQDALDGLFNEWSATSKHLDEAMDAFWSQNPQALEQAVGALARRWVDYGAAAAVLQSVALDALRPTVVGETLADVRRAAKPRPRD